MEELADAAESFEIRRPEGSSWLIILIHFYLLTIDSKIIRGSVVVCCHYCVLNVAYFLKSYLVCYCIFVCAWTSGGPRFFLMEGVQVFLTSKNYTISDLQIKNFKFS